MKSNVNSYFIFTYDICTFFELFCTFVILSSLQNDLLLLLEEAFWCQSSSLLFAIAAGNGNVSPTLLLCQYYYTIPSSI